MQKKLIQIEKEFEQDITELSSRETLEAVKIKFLGRKGSVAAVFKEMGQLSAEEKPLFGQKINELKDKLNQKIAEKEQELEAREKNDILSGKANAFDISLPSVRKEIGSPHPLTIVMEEVCDLFVEMGFTIVEGPEIETEYYNFEALNIPLEHPSRESFDTFYLTEKFLLRSHTSPVQVRVMENSKPPVQIIVPGRVYRPDAVDASHSYMFHQIEGLLVDKDITFSHLKGVLSVFTKKLFGQSTQTRFRPSFFPFTEPSAEVDVSCFICGGKGCGVCGQSGWIEILGSGMVHPKVLTAGGIDSNIYSGFAFGMGVERIAMLKYGINDIRLFYDNDLRFTKQFG
ncbi:MAG: phenylalanine--tRNA ligase subunit alpha [Candidatus Omnitrophota bacterium]